MSFHGTTTNKVRGNQNNFNRTYNSSAHYPHGGGPVQNNYGSATAHGGSVVYGNVEGAMSHGTPSYPPPPTAPWPNSPMPNGPLTEEPEDYDRGRDNRTQSRTQSQGTWSEPDVFAQYNGQRGYRQDPRPHRATRPAPTPMPQRAPAHTMPPPPINPWQAQNYSQSPLSRASSTFDETFGEAFDEGLYDDPSDPNAQVPPLDSGYASGTSYTAVPTRRETNPFHRLALEDQRRNTNKPFGYAQ